MVQPSVGDVVLVQFPFSDLSDVKLRPAAVVADGGKGDWLLCQITSNAYADNIAIEVTAADFSSGTLPVTSYVRPAKMFCASERIMARSVGTLTQSTLRRTVQAVIALLQSSLPTGDIET